MNMESLSGRCPERSVFTAGNEPATLNLSSLFLSSCIVAHSDFAVFLKGAL
jgi:hypothetical protein